MKLVLVFAVLLFSSFASAVEVPCSTDSVEVVKAVYSTENESTLVTIKLFARDEDYWDLRFLKAITYKLEGEVRKEEVKTNLQIKINVFRRIRICLLDVTTED